ncbi:MAG: hypothetical protein LBU04_04025 [Christensenellaceae bacterium]|jgi:hypothetical protein|nr:hypothetical protein [Christensenellaceae bacterium]
MKELNIEEQCQYLGIGCSSYYYKKRDKKAILGWIQGVMIELPFYRYRKIYEVLKEVIEVTKKKKKGDDYK